MSFDITMPTAFRARHEATIGPGATTGRIWWFLAAIAVVVCVYLHWQVSLTATAPRTPWDENHLLQMARLISGDSDVTPLSGSGYYPGWAIIMAPIWWFTHDAPTVYSAAVILSNVLGVATIAPLALIARRFRLSLPQAVVAAAIVMSLPGRTVLADYALSEQALLFFYAWTVLAMLRLWERPTLVRTAVFALAVAAAYLTHSRALVLLATAAVWLLFLLRRNWRVSVLGLVLVTIAWRLVDSFSRAVAGQVLLNGYGKEDVLKTALENAYPGLFARVFANQVWAQIVGTAGLVAVGAVVIGIWTVRELRSRRLGPGAFLLGMTFSALLMSVVWWTRGDMLWDAGYVRLDVWVYTRYLDHVAVFVALVALAALFRRVSVGVLLTALAGAVALSSLVVFWVARDVPLWGALDGPGNSAAILSWAGLFPSDPYPRPLTPTLTNENRFWIWASLFAITTVAAMVVLRHFARIAAVVFLTTATVLSLLADPSQSRDYPANIEAAIVSAEAVDPDDALLPVDFDYSCRGPALTRYQALNWLGFWLSPRDVNFVDPGAGDEFTSNLVVSCGDWAEAATLGARAVDGGTSYTYRVWVLPGELQDELAAAGRLRP